MPITRPLVSVGAEEGGGRSTADKSWKGQKIKWWYVFIHIRSKKLSKYLSIFSSFGLVQLKNLPPSEEWNIAKFLGINRNANANEMNARQKLKDLMYDLSLKDCFRELVPTGGFTWQRNNTLKDIVGLG